MDVEGMLAAEDAGWHGLCEVLDRFTADQMEEPGVTPDGWSPKDVMFHVAAWMADAGFKPSALPIMTASSARVTATEGRATAVCA